MERTFGSPAPLRGGSARKPGCSPLSRPRKLPQGKRRYQPDTPSRPRMVIMVPVMVAISFASPSSAKA